MVLWWDKDLCWREDSWQVVMKVVGFLLLVFHSDSESFIRKNTAGFVICPPRTSQKQSGLYHHFEHLSRWFLQPPKQGHVANPVWGFQLKFPGLCACATDFRQGYWVAWLAIRRRHENSRHSHVGVRHHVLILAYWKRWSFQTRNYMYNCFVGCSLLLCWSCIIYCNYNIMIDIVCICPPKLT